MQTLDEGKTAMKTRQLQPTRSKLDGAIVASILATLGVNLLYIAGQMQAAPVFAILPGTGALA